jgi:hypothetical protein
MATIEQAVAAKEIFKNNFWKLNPDIFNIITINEQYVLDENDDIIGEDFNIKIYLFDINNGKDFPSDIDGVEIVYLPVVAKDV